MPKIDHAPVPLPPPLLFLGFLILALALNWLKPLGIAPSAGLLTAAVLTTLAGLILGFLAVRQMRRAHTSPDPGEPTTALVATGPYRFSRNPIYLGFTLLVLGISLLARTWWGLILTPLCILIVSRLIIRAEEAYLLDRFGEQYRRYTAQVRRWI